MAQRFNEIDPNSSEDCPVRQHASSSARQARSLEQAGFSGQSEVNQDVFYAIGGMTAKIDSLTREVSHLGERLSAIEARQGGDSGSIRVIFAVAGAGVAVLTLILGLGGIFVALIPLVAEDDEHRGYPQVQPAPLTQPR